MRTGPLSPAMLSGPANDYFSDTHHMRGGFPTPNESSLRTGLTPGGSGSMFPAPSPNSQALFASLTSGGATPSTLDFHRTAISAAAKRDQTNGGQPHSSSQSQATQQQSVTSQPQEVPAASTIIKAESKTATGPFDPHDTDDANGLFMLAQGRNGTQNPNQFAVSSGAPGHAHPAAAPPPNMNTSPQMSSVNGGSVGSGRGMSEGSMMSEESDQARPNTRGKGRRNAPVTNGRRKADESPAKPPPNKKAKSSNGNVHDNGHMDMDFSDDDMKLKGEDGGSKSKMTDEEKRKNFLERNR